MIFLEFTPEHIDGVVELERKCFSDGWNKAQITSAFNSGLYFGFLAFDGEHLVGFVACTAGLDVCDLESVAVLPEYRGQGIGKKLVSLAIEKTLKKRLTQMLLEVRESNVNAISLYERCGFEKISVRKKYYPDGENAVVYKKEL